MWWSLSKKKKQHPFTAEDAIKLRNNYRPNKTIEDAYKTIRVMAKYGHEELILTSDEYKDLFSIAETLKRDGYKVTGSTKNIMVSWKKEDVKDSLLHEIAERNRLLLEKYEKLQAELERLQPVASNKPNSRATKPLSISPYKSI